MLPSDRSDSAENATAVLDEPMKMGSLVRDKDGDLWQRGRTRWSCLAPVDGVRVLRAGRLPWYELARQYGPLELVRAGRPPNREGEDRGE